MIASLAPFFAGALRPFGERVGIAAAGAPQAAAAGGSLWLGAFGQPQARDCLARQARALGCDDLRALAAAWFRDYTLALLPSALVAAALLRRRLPFDAPRAAWHGAADGLLACLLLPHEGERLPVPLPALLAPLVNTHLPDVVAALSAAAKVSPRLLWCTGGVAAAGVARQLAAHPALGAPARAEVAAWIGQAVSDGGIANPYHGAFRPGREPGTPGVAPLRRICCLNHRLPGEGHCGTCPLPRARAATAQTGTAVVAAG
ncbi:siderophore-iron reductase FhuF [Cupriavidus sp. 30B13]|uniref:siderophore-iron reductase FhuF n=1 Tax=Cupriavidus sp. 30B13 TaxID=3384241 RepID=UPI003B91E746